MRVVRTCLVAAAIMAGTASSSLAQDTSGLIGTLLGAGFGGYVGSNIGHGTGKLVATGAGTFLGGVLGNQLFRSGGGLGGSGYYQPQPTYYQPQPVYYQQPVYYHPAPVYYQPAPVYYEPSPPRVVYYQPAPPPPPAVSYDSVYCREGTWQGVIGGTYQQIYGTACRQPDGSWRITP